MDWTTWGRKLSSAPSQKFCVNPLHEATMRPTFACFLMLFIDIGSNRPRFCQIDLASALESMSEMYIVDFHTSCSTSRIYEYATCRPSQSAHRYRYQYIGSPSQNFIGTLNDQSTREEEQAQYHLADGFWHFTEYKCECVPSQVTRERHIPYFVLGVERPG